ncbi:hypothetical protein L7F22_060238 [Adiantum nelumboides]|nr:hypothetical protein [Adiantum nelumboides]
MDGNKEEGSSSEDKKPIPTAHEIGESSGQAEDALQVVTAVTMFKQLMENPRFCFWFLAVEIDSILVQVRDRDYLFQICNWFLFELVQDLFYFVTDLVQVQIRISDLFLVTGSVIRGETVAQVLDWSLVQIYWLADLVLCFVIGSGSEVASQSGSGPSAGTQGSATQDPHIAASDSSSDFDVMEGYPMQQHPESFSQDMHALGQQPGVSTFSRLKETLSRATRSEHATNEINERDGEVDSPFTSQIDTVLSESVHVSTPATTPIGLSKLTPSKTLLPDGRSLAKVQEVECYILAAREKDIESLRKAEQRRATLAKTPMTLANPLQSPELTILKSQPIGSHIASGSKDIPNASILDGVFLNENWEYNLQTEKLTNLYTSYTYHVDWLDVIQATSNSTSVDEQQRMICDVIHSIVQMERQNLGINMPSMGSMRFLDTTKAKQPTISQMENPSVSPMDPSYAMDVRRGDPQTHIEHSEWVSPIFIVPKKNGKLRVCVDLKKVNAATRRDHYPLPYSEHVLERVVDKEAYSFLDGYSGYNQITIALEDQAKTAFKTEFGVFAFRVMAFGLTNAPATFQRLINTAFKEYLRDFCEAFLDDLCIYSSWEEHLSCLKKVFEKCRLYCISLNSFKCQFWVKHGVILGHIVSKNGISTDEGILELPPPHNYKGVQRFMGHVGDYRRFILLFAEIARPLYKLLNEFKWTKECNQAYEVLKKALASAPILRAPDWNIIFHVHIDASNFAIGCVLTQPGEHKLDYPISFASRQLNDAERTTLLQSEKV